MLVLICSSLQIALKVDSNTMTIHDDGLPPPLQLLLLLNLRLIKLLRILQYFTAPVTIGVEYPSI